MPPPLAAGLPEMLQLVIVTVPPPLLERPPLRIPPPRSPGALPLAIVKPLIKALTLEEAILKMRKLPAPRRTVSRFAPGPLIVRFLLINNSPLVRLIGLTTLDISKVIVLPAHALAIMSRSELGPLSLLLLTTTLMVLQSGGSCTS